MARRYEFYVLVARTISHSFAAPTREILLLPLEHKIHIFSASCNILYIFLEGRTLAQYKEFFFQILVDRRRIHLLRGGGERGGGGGEWLVRGTFL